MTCDEQLEQLGFERLGPCADSADVTMWLRSGGPDMLVLQSREDTHSSDAARLIYEAGLRDKRDEIAGRWKAFTDAMRQPAVSELWTQARALQKERQEAETQRLSMLK
jgi:hypothetical protein